MLVSELEDTEDKALSARLLASLAALSASSASLDHSEPRSLSLALPVAEQIHKLLKFGKTPTESTK